MIQRFSKEATLLPADNRSEEKPAARQIGMTSRSSAKCSGTDGLLLFNSSKKCKAKAEVSTASPVRRLGMTTWSVRLESSNFGNSKHFHFSAAEEEPLHGREGEHGQPVAH